MTRSGDKGAEYARLLAVALANARARARLYRAGVSGEQVAALEAAKHAALDAADAVYGW